MRFLHLFVFIASLRYFRHHNRDTGAFIQLTLYGQAVFFPEIDLDTVIYILDSDSGTVASLLFQYFLALFFCHANSVVLHRKDDLVFALMDANPDHALIYHTIHAVINCILDDRLQCDFITVIRKACLINVKLIPELIFIAEILNMQIALCMLQLFLNRDQLMSAADADAEQPWRTSSISFCIRTAICSNESDRAEISLVPVTG